MTGIQKRQHQKILAAVRKRIGLRRRMLAWFEANPSDDLTVDQLAVKFDAKPQIVKVELSRLKAEGAIEAMKVYRLKVEVE